MTLTTDQYRTRAAFEQAFAAQVKATPVDVDSLRGCLMMATQMAQVLHLPLKDLQSLVAEESVLWEEYVAAKLAIIARRKEKK